MSEEAETLPKREKFHKGIFFELHQFEMNLIQRWNFTYAARCEEPRWQPAKRRGKRSTHHTAVEEKLLYHHRRAIEKAEQRNICRAHGQVPAIRDVESYECGRPTNR